MPSLGLVIPTYNSRRYLDRHVEGLLPWLDLVQEIVVVDSHSTDGSANFLRERLPHPNLRIEQYPPGLYASWNHGIRCLQTDYFIMSTTGDTVSREGIELLLLCAEREQSDVILSKPVFVDLHGQIRQITWPVDDMIAGMSPGESRTFSGLEALAYAMGRPDSALLGSSASNLYRTEFFKRRPFPLDWGVAGDAGWVWEHVAEARWGVIAGNYSIFLVHPPQSHTTDLHPSVRHRVDEVLGCSVKRWVSEGVLKQKDLECIGWPSLFEAFRGYLSCKENFDASRRAKGVWFLRPSAWMQRSRRKKAAFGLFESRDNSLSAFEKAAAVSDVP